MLHVDTSTFVCVYGIVIVLSRRIDVCFKEEGKASGGEERNCAGRRGRIHCIPHFDVHEQDWKRVEITLLYMYYGEMRKVLYKRRGKSSLVWVTRQVESGPIEWMVFGVSATGFSNELALGKGQGPRK